MSGARPSSRDVAHEAEDTRASLASTLEQLRTNLQPQNVMEEVVSNARIGAASVADNLAGVARQYPIPSVLVAAGSALLMRFFSKRGDTLDHEPTVRAPASRARLSRDPDFQPAPGRGGSTGSALAEARESVAAGGAALRRQASDAAGAVSWRAGEAVHTMSRYLPSDRGQMKSKLATLFDEQPLVLGAIGLAVGAAIGAALPMTETEDNLMGGAAQRFRDQATDAARHEVDGMRAAAGEALGNVRQATQENLKNVVDKAGDSFAHGSRDV